LSLLTAGELRQAGFGHVPRPASYTIHVYVPHPHGSKLVIWTLRHALPCVHLGTRFAFCPPWDSSEITPSPQDVHHVGGASNFFLEKKLSSIFVSPLGAALEGSCRGHSKV
jgi:hypothetical protein